MSSPSACVPNPESSTLPRYFDPGVTTGASGDSNRANAEHPLKKIPCNVDRKCCTEKQNPRVIYEIYASNSGSCALVLFRGRMLATEQLFLVAFLLLFGLPGLRGLCERSVVLLSVTIPPSFVTLRSRGTRSISERRRQIGWKGIL